MQLATPILMAIELAFNQYLILDGESLPQFKALNDKVICLHITGLDIRLYFLPSEHGVQVLSQYGGEPDTTIAAPPMTLMRLSSAEDAGQFLLSSSATITGNAGVGMHFSQVLRDVDIHWQDLLSTIVGDIIAQQSGQLLDQGKGWLSDSHQAMQMNVGEYLSEEQKLTPAADEVRALIDEVDTLRDDAARLDAKIARLEQTLHKS